MNIEGTPNERALLVFFAYVCGFTAALILFRFALTDPVAVEVSQPIIQPSNQAASVAGALPAVAGEESAAIETTQQLVSDRLQYKNQGLYFMTDDVDVPLLLSKDISATTFTYLDLPTLRDRQGFHTAIPVYQHFANSSYLYYCEQYDVTGQCTPFLFDTQSQTLHAIQDESGPLTLSTNEARSVVRTAAGSIVIGSFQSVSPDEPWLVRPR